MVSRIPLFVILLSTCSGLTASADEKRRQADLFLRPPVEGYSMMGGSNIDKIVELGYRYTLDQPEQVAP